MNAMAAEEAAESLADSGLESSDSQRTLLSSSSSLPRKKEVSTVYNFAEIHQTVHNVDAMLTTKMKAFSGSL